MPKDSNEHVVSIVIFIDSSNCPIKLCIVTVAARVKYLLGVYVAILQGKLALCACNHRFLTVTGEGKLMAVSEKAREKEILTVR